MADPDALLAIIAGAAGACVKMCNLAANSSIFKKLTYLGTYSSSSIAVRNGGHRAKVG